MNIMKSISDAVVAIMEWWSPAPIDPPKVGEIWEVYFDDGGKQPDEQVLVEIVGVEKRDDSTYVAYSFTIHPLVRVLELDLFMRLHRRVAA